MELITSVLVCLLILLMKTLWSMKRKGTSRKLPGPPVLEAFRSLLNTSSKTGLHVTVTDWAGVYGDVLALSLPGQSIVFLNDADVVKEAFSSDFNKTLANDRQGTFATKFVFDNGSLGFLPLGQDHSRLRRLFNTALRQYGEGVDAYEYQVREELDYLVRELSKQNNVDLKTALSASLMNCIHTLLLGRRADRDSPSLVAMLEFNESMKKLLRYELDAMLTMFPFLRHIPGYYKAICDGVDDSKAKLLRYVFEDVKRCLEMGSGEGFIHNVLREQSRREDDHTTRVTDQHIKCFILDVLNAGYMTTRGALLGAMLCIINYQDVQENIYQELSAKLGTREVTLEDRGDLPYLDAVILEVLRYTSHTPFSIPHLTRGDIETSGYKIPRGSLLVANLWSIHHDDRVYGDPWTFRPERFLDSSGRLLPRDHPVMRKSLPFSTGKRQCPGAGFATTRLFLYIATLVQKFHFRQKNNENTTSADPRTWQPGVILHLPEIRCQVINRH